jgi:hypothetical protein
MLKNSSGDPKLWYVRISNCSENDYVTVLNCSLIRGGSFRRPDSSDSRTAVRYSEGPRFESRSGCTLKINNLKKVEVFQSLLMGKKYLVSKVCKGSIGRELFLGKPDLIPTMQSYRLNASVVLLWKLYILSLISVVQQNPTVCWGLKMLLCSGIFKHTWVLY